MRDYHHVNIILTEDIFQGIIHSIDEIEKIIGHKIVFGAIGGSYSLGLQNGSSDIDCYLIVEGGSSLGVEQKSVTLSVRGKRAPIDFMCVSYNTVLNEIEEYNKIPKNYPTVFYRTDKAREENIKRKDVARPDFKRSILFRILLGDHIIHITSAKEKSNEYASGILIRDIIDYQFTRIYGNYKEVIYQKQFVPVRKYLYVIHEICTCESLMNSPQKPPMDFLRLIEGTIFDESLKYKAISLYKKNRQSTRAKAYETTAQDTEINRFIADEIDKVSDYLKMSVPNEEVLTF